MLTKKLQRYIDEMESLASQHELSNSKISASSIGWHLEHTLLVLEKSMSALASSVKANYSPKSSFKKTVILFTGKIPRGVARSPKHVLPEASNIDVENLLARIAAVKSKLESVSTFPADQYISHPIFGDLKLKKAVRFLEIHSFHHLKIVREILGKGEGRYPF